MFGVELARRFDYSKVQLECDSMVVVKAIEQKDDGYAPINLLLDNIALLCIDFTGFGCSYVRKGGNTLAHCIARWDIGLANEKDLFGPFPQGVQTLVELHLF